MTAAERFATHLAEGPIPTHRPDLGPCLLWVRGEMTANGYGRFTCDGRRTLAHRWAWEQAHGPLPPDVELDHLCRVHACVRHLEPVTKVENQRRGLLTNQNKTRCPKGHPYDEANTRVYQGRRYCRACMAEVGRTRDREKMRAYRRAYKRRRAALAR